MLVKMGKADALLGGATYSTADTVRPALQLVKTKPGAHLVSSCFIMVRGDEMLAMGDCAINIDYHGHRGQGRQRRRSPPRTSWPRSASSAPSTAKVFGIDPKVAFLSYSTKGSGKGPQRGPEPARPAAKAKAAGPRARHRRRDAVRRRRLPHRRPAEVPRLARSLATPTPSSSRRSSPATSAIRSPSAWAASTPTAPSCRA